MYGCGQGGFRKATREEDHHRAPQLLVRARHGVGQPGTEGPLGAEVKMEAPTAGCSGLERERICRLNAECSPGGKVEPSVRVPAATQRGDSRGASR